MLPNQCLTLYFTHLAGLCWEAGPESGQAGFAGAQRPVRGGPAAAAHEPGVLARGPASRAARHVVRGEGAGLGAAQGDGVHTGPTTDRTTVNLDARFCISSALLVAVWITGPQMVQYGVLYARY